ncbi:MAG: TonB-dependent receptor [Candidatus Acidiferrales bacterium]
MRLLRLLLVTFLASTVFAIGAQSLLAQTASTGALTGTVTDPSGGVIAGATVKVTNLATGQTRTATTDANGSYQLSLLPPGNYSVHFEATGFTSTDVPSITINVTETPTLNRKLEIGTSTQQVTVEANTQSIQTENATNGTVVGTEEINNLPLVTRNYTQIVDLSPGVGGNVANATALGNGTQDVNAAGQSGLSNSYSMDGANITQYTSGGAAQIGSMPGIPIPNPDTIQEFKVQTSQYDAGYGRNSGANVEVITKTGQNNFHGDLWEFNRNNFFNANDFFYKNSELAQGQANTPQTLKENTFGFTLGGPIKKNKILFFGSYQGFRQIDGIATNGFAGGYEPAVYLMPWNDYADQASGACADLRCSNNIPAYRTYLGSVFGPGSTVCAPYPTGFGVPSSPTGTPINCNTGYTDGVTVANDGSNITNTAIALLQAKGPTKGGRYNQGGYLIAAAPQNCPLAIAGLPSSGCKSALSVPLIANENQYMMNSQYNLTPKNTLYENYFYSSDPEIDSFDCLFSGSCNPGSPAHDIYTSHTGTLRLQSVLTPNLINEARFTFYRDGEVATDPTTLSACDLPNGASIIPQNNNGEPCSSNVKYANAYMGIVPTIDVLDLYSPDAGDWSQGINFAGVGENIDNDFQAGDQVSWNHGIHTLRFGFEWDHQQYNNNTVASAKGEVLFDNNGDFLTSSSGTTIDGTPQTGLGPGGTGTQTLGCGFFGSAICAGGAAPIALRGLLTHYNRIGDYDAFVQDDIKVSSRLTVNAGVRWEYQGWPSDALGQFANLWQSQMAKVNTGSFFLADAAAPGCANGPDAPVLPVGTLAGFVVPSNFDKTAGLTNPCGAAGVLQLQNKTLLSGSPLDNFMPRLGVAWQPFGNKLVVRAGYGWFYDEAGSIYLIDNLLQEPPYSGPIAGTAVTDLENTLHTPFQSIVGIPLTWTPRYFAPGSFNLNGYNTGTLSYSALANANDSNTMSQHLPLTQQYNLDFQYALRGSWVIDVGYLGSHSIHLLNQGTPYNVAHLVGSPSTLLCGGVTGDCKPQDLAMFNNPTFPGGNPIPFNDPANTTPVTVNTTQNTPARVSYIGFTPGDTYTTTLGDDLYDALLVNLRHNFSNGMLLQASYTWSHNKTNVNASEAGELDTGQTDFGTSGSNNPLDLAQQYGPDSAERTQRLIVSYSYDLPWKSTQGFSGKLLGGWTVSGVTTLQNGQPLTVTDAGGGSIYGTGSRALLTDPVDCGANGVCKSGIAVATPGSTVSRVISGMQTGGAGWINTAAFTSLANISPTSPYCIGGVPNPVDPGVTTTTCGAAPVFAPGAPLVAAGTGWGDSAVAIVNGPGQWNWDMSVQKNTKVTEWGTLQFRAEFYNIWNHAQFSNPVSTGYPSSLLGSTFGDIQSTSVEPRVIQFGLKFLF